MAYTKHTWSTGEVITAGKLNSMEDGIADAGVVMVINNTNGTLDKTWQEIYDAMAQGKLCVVKNDTGDLEGGIVANTVTAIYVDGGTYTVYNSAEYTASLATGYPKIDIGGGGQ